MRLLKFLIFIKASHKPQTSMQPILKNKIQVICQQQTQTDELQSTNCLTVNRVLIRLSKDPNLRTSYGFIKNLFQNHPHIIYEMIQWMLMPNTMANRKNYKEKYDPLIYLSKDFMKENWCFYEILFLYIKKHDFSFLTFYEFLHPQNYDPHTIHTALGYFREILIPFAKYSFSSSFSLTAALQIVDTTQFGGIMQILTQDVLTSIIHYAHHKQIYDFLMTAYLVGVQDKINYQSSKILIDTIFQYCQFPNILSIFTHQQKNEEQIQNIYEEYSTLQNVCKTIREIIQNIEPHQDLTFRMKSVIIALLRSNLIIYIIRQLLNSTYVRLQIKKQSSLQQQDACKQQDQIGSQDKISLGSLFQSSPLKVSRKKSQSSLLSYEQFWAQKIQQLQIIEVMMIILTNFLKIYDKLSQIKVQADQDQEISYIVEQFQSQIVYILNNLKYINRMVHKETKTIQNWLECTTGQQIKPTTLAKYQYFKLLHQILLITAHSNHSICPLSQIPTQNQNHYAQKHKQDININKSIIKNYDISELHIINIIQRYLYQNKWNNICHHVLQRIFELLVITRPQYLIENIKQAQGKSISQSFLAYLFQNFLQKDYIFLNTFRFTSQGNLNTLFNMSKILAYSLNTNNQLVKLLNGFDGWKKFIMVDLKKYEEKVNPKHTIPEKQLRNSGQERYSEIKIDEVDTISKLIEDISITQKWPNKSNKVQKK